MNAFQSQLIINEEPMIDLHNRLAEKELSGFEPAFEGSTDIFRVDPLGDYSVLVGKFHNQHVRRQVSVEEFLGL